MEIRRVLKWLIIFYRPSQSRLKKIPCRCFVCGIEGKRKVNGADYFLISISLCFSLV
jgi:hypothetical protein